jgi:hypothetical protein
MPADWVAKRMECVQLAAAFELPCINESGSKLHALHTLREVRLWFCCACVCLWLSAE